MRIEVWSDVVCPWCYLGKRRLERAIESFDGDVEVIWRAFQLQPDAPKFGEPGAGRPTSEYLAERQFGPAQIEEMQSRLTDLAAAEGLDYRLERSHHVNTLQAHRLIRAATEPEIASALVERLFQAQLIDGLRIDDPAVLGALAAEVGMQAAEEVLDGGASEAVEEDLATAGQLAIQGVPFFVFDRRLAVSGAQPVEVLTQALQDLGNLPTTNRGSG